MGSRESLRYDLFISHSRSETVFNRTMELFAEGVKQRLTKYANEYGAEPSIFNSSSIKDNILRETIEGLMQGRGGGTGLILLTPTYFDDPMRCMEFAALFKERSGRKSSVIVRVYCIDCTCDAFRADVWAADMLNRYLRDTVILNVPETTFEGAAHEIATQISNDWRSSNSGTSSAGVTLCGRTMEISLDYLAKEFEDVASDLATFFNCRTSRSHAVFAEAIEHNKLDYQNVEELLRFCRTRVSHKKSKKLAYVFAYKQKWINTNRLDWSSTMVEEIRSLYVEFCYSKHERTKSRPDFDRISTGSSQVSPSRQPIRGGSRTSTSSYTVQSGDTLWIIAGKKLGNPNRYLEIFQLNRNVLKDDPNLIFPGMKLILPSP